MKTSLKTTIQTFCHDLSAKTRITVLCCGCFLVLTGLAAAGGQFGVTAAYTYAPAREISVYDYTQIMFSAIMGLLVFGQLPDMLSFVGYCVIIAAGVIMFLYNKRRGGN